MKQTSPESAATRLMQIKAQQDRRSKRRLRSALITIGSIAALFGAIVLVLNHSGSMLSGLLGDTPGVDLEMQQAQEAMQETSTVTVAAVGNLSISDAQLADARGNDLYDFSPSFLGVAELLNETDLTIGNLECNFNGAPFGTDSASAPNALADTLVGLGFDLLQTSNSASIHNGVNGLVATNNAIVDAGMQPVGTFVSAKERNACGGMTLREINGVRVGFIAFTKGLDNMSLPSDSQYAIHLLYEDYDTNYTKLNTAGIEAAMKAAREQEPDVLIALVHWGSEYSREITSAQKRVEELLYENGADAIIGTHSHLVGAVKDKEITVSGAKKRVLTAYDLGSFYTESSRSDIQTGLVLRLEFTKNNWTGQTSLTDWSYTPVYCADFGPRETHRFQIMNLQNAIEMYESNYVFRVPDKVYEDLKEIQEELPEYLQLEEKE